MHQTYASGDRVLSNTGGEDPRGEPRTTHRTLERDEDSARIDIAALATEILALDTAEAEVARILEFRDNTITPALANYSEVILDFGAAGAAIPSGLLRLLFSHPEALGTSSAALEKKLRVSSPHNRFLLREALAIAGVD